MPSHAPRSRSALPVLLLTFTAALPGCASRSNSDSAALPVADQLARRVHLQSGGHRWHNIKRLQFTFNVDRDGKTVLSAHHDWDLTTGIDRITVAGQTTTLSLAGPHDTPELQKAYARWTNDSYWLLAPLKLLDPGVKRTLLDPTTIDGTRYETLEISFDTVGLTPGDRYRLYILPKSGLVRFWDYIPQPGKSTRFSWESYQAAGPLTLSTNHLTPDGKTRIHFTNLSAETR